MSLLQHVLLADDDPEVAWFLGRSMTRAGFKVTTCGDGVEAIALLENQSFDVLITDIQMPRLNGLALIEWVHDHRPELRIIAITGFGSSTVKEVSLSKGASLYLEKPVDPRLLIDVLRYYCEVDEVSGARASTVDPLLQTLLEAVSSGSGGEVVVRSQQQVGHVFFVGGKCAWAFVSGDTGNLAADLIEQADLDREDLQTAFEECKASGSNFAETLIEWGLIDSARLRAILLDRIAHCIREMFGWSEIQTMFVPKQRSYSSGLLYSIEEVLTATRVIQGALADEAADRRPHSGDTGDGNPVNTVA